MTTVTGRLERMDLGPGAWVLRTDDGRRVLLHGDVPAELTGQRVEVRGAVEESMGFAMTGDETLTVQAVRRSTAD